MADPFLGEISIVGIRYAPRGWAFCDGQQMAISQHTPLYSVIGTVFGGDGRTYFNLPDLRGKVPVGTGKDCPIGEKGGSEQVVLTKDCLPVHTHPFYGINAPGTKSGPGKDHNTMLANDDNTDFFDSSPKNIVLLRADSVSNTGGNIPHYNLQPSLGLNFIIALEGIYPV
ncbi:MAG: tail fiber protein [Victivallaceae bacterium]|nr:tail fiber protein [Victivallaceae bacterium]